MDYTVRPLQEKDIAQASSLDKKWFGEHGISEEELNAHIATHQEESLAILEGDFLLGFAVFEILDDRKPKDYVGEILPTHRVLFIQQFTTKTNYGMRDMEMDKTLLLAIQNKAQERKCSDVWIALSKDHPYKKENTPDFDAFVFLNLTVMSLTRNCR